MLDAQVRVTGHRSRPEASGGVQGNLTPSANPNIDNLPEVFDDDDDWNFDGVIGGESAQRGVVKLLLQDLQD